MPGKYIVVFKKSATPDQIQEYVDSVNSNGGRVKDIWTNPLKGFSAEIPDSFVQSLQAKAFSNEDIVDYIEEDQVVTTQ
ncbi:hypothetical protein BDN72DRAFT_846511 [Pluteus cervinus]|uniref:Uncharacterized protein n=1 Tax=Pluteus cervinus TaxID=181527 RepID=A0ACD3AFK6_9AGAR|nr:hypothetical protein BDN72DRAFT_846511 [Pluteus cervinus]